MFPRLLATLVLLVAVSCTYAPRQPQQESTMSNAAATMNSKERTRLYKEASALANSKSAADHQALGRQLQDPQFLANLDSEEDYQGKPERLRVAGVMQTLAQNSAPSARQQLVALTQSKSFLDHRSRVNLLIRALAEIRPAPPEAIKFWDSHSQPEDGYSNVTMKAVIENGSPPAITVFEQKIVDPQHPEEDRYSWLVIEVLTHRNDLPLLQASERILNSQLEPELKTLLIEVLFDYKPEEWFRACGWVKPPERIEAGKDSLLQQQKMGAKALEMRLLNEQQRANVEQVMKWIAERLKKMS